MKPVMSEMRTAVVGALIVTLGPLSLSLYTPAMPMLVEAFGTTPAAVKLTLSVYFFGFAFSQLACGPLSDAYGRRPVALGFFAVYALGSVVAALSASIDWLLAGRLLQGVGAAAGIAISRAIVRDQFTGQNSARILNLIGLMLAIAPAMAPTLGGLILGTVGWHAIFLVMAVYGLVVLLLFAGVPETNAARNPDNARPSRVLRNYATLLADRRFMRAGLVLGLTLGGLYTLAALLPFVMIETVGMTPTHFGMAMLLQTGSYTAGAALSGRLLHKVDARRLIPAGLALVLLGALGFAVGLRLLPPSLATVMGPAALWAFGIALVMPGATSDALAGYPTIAGAASALTGFLQIGGGLAGSTAAALLFANPFVALTDVIPGMAVLAVIAHVLLGEGGRRTASAPAPADLEVAVDPAAVLGAGGDEIEAALARRSEKAAGGRGRP
ncbi:DHA1 family bicyclomycin/chloramphenicol resistance-like MFS transporter [Azospirillum agricola]|uniref:multidrug effflux MFS transporter n=1 Tax=Azospirillum agricola TaxID=1720247 RepID=UPI001AEA244D|nr:multidrug effflux MFS transporter [Azospirillum agricola]MBP2230973.1 DHA1 family bicyclomycin/chloramphenicol resistance-like MFS transporter [Azospirillum agricola]